MQTYVIRRRSNWANATALETTASLSARIGNEEMPNEVRWIRSYVVRETDGKLGTVCIYQATSPEAILKHANRAGMSADEIIAVEATVIVRDDPVEPAKAA